MKKGETLVKKKWQTRVKKVTNLSEKVYKMKKKWKNWQTSVKKWQNVKKKSHRLVKKSKKK